MRIASIDPGKQTGLLIATIDIGEDRIFLTPKDIVTLDSPDEVMTKVLASRCKVVTMEQRPLYAPSQSGLENHSILMREFMRRQYQRSRATPFTLGRTLILVMPGMWKPFMASKAGVVPMKFATPHEKDAAFLLHYTIQICYPSKEIRYA